MAEAGDASARLRRLELATEPETELAAHGQSGLLSRLPPGHTEAAVLAAALQQLTAVTRALTHNVRHMNGSLERALLDKEQIDELEGMLVMNRPEDQFETRIQQAIQYKVEGNLYYKQKRVREAISRYHWAIMHLRGLDPEQPTPLQAFGGEKIKLSPEQTELLYSTECDCYNNLAACLLLSEKVNYERVRDYCLKVLGRQPGNTKALYRAGVSLYNIGDYDRALHYLTEASKICPNDANIKRYIQETELRLNRYYENEKVMYKGMFGK